MKFVCGAGPRRSTSPSTPPFLSATTCLAKAPSGRPPGDAVRAVKATVRIGKVVAEAPVEPGAKEVVLQMALPAGKTRMTAHFTTRGGGTVGAFCVYVKKR